MKNLIPSLLSLALIGIATAQSDSTTATRTATWLPAESVNAEQVIGPPCAMNSAAFREQMAIVLWLQTSRSPDQIEFVRKPLDLARFAPLLSEDLLAVDGNRLSAVLDEIIEEVRADYDVVKDEFDLPRPFVANKDVKPVADARPVASYPSGHAIRAVVYARLLGDIFPERKDDLINLALQIGYGRVTAGVHYPIDVIAGQKLGNAYADVIIKQPAWRDAVENIRSQSSEAVPAN